MFFLFLDSTYKRDVCLAVCAFHVWANIARTDIIQKELFVLFVWFCVVNFGLFECCVYVHVSVVVVVFLCVKKIIISIHLFVLYHIFQHKYRTNRQILQYSIICACVLVSYYT